MATGNSDALDDSVVALSKLNLAPAIAGAFGKSGFSNVSHEQAAVIRLGKSGRDIVGLSKPGIGNILVYITVVLERINCESSSLQAIIISPTVVASEKIHSLLQQIGHFIPKFRSSCVDGAGRIEETVEALRELRPQVIVGVAKVILELVQFLDADVSNDCLVVVHEVEDEFNNEMLKHVETIVFGIRRQQQLLAFVSDSNLTLFHRFIESRGRAELDDTSSAHSLPHMAPTPTPPIDRANLIYEGNDEKLKKWLIDCSKNCKKIFIRFEASCQRGIAKENNQTLEAVKENSWQMYWSEEHQSCFYYDHSTGKSSWDDPSLQKFPHELDEDTSANAENPKLATSSDDEEFAGNSESFARRYSNWLFKKEKLLDPGPSRPWKPHFVNSLLEHSDNS